MTTPKQDAAPATTPVSATVKPNGAGRNYLAYGTVPKDGAFQQRGFPRDVLKAHVTAERGTAGAESYAYDVTFNVPATFRYHIVQVYLDLAGAIERVEVRWTPRR